MTKPVVSLSSLSRDENRVMLLIARIIQENIKPDWEMSQEKYKFDNLHFELNEPSSDTITVSITLTGARRV